MFRNSERNRSRYGETIKTHEKKTYQVIDSNGDVWTDGSMGLGNPANTAWKLVVSMLLGGTGLFISIRLLSNSQGKQQGREE